MDIETGLELELPDQKENSAPSKKTPLLIKSTLEYFLSQGGKTLREFPTSVKEIFLGGREPQDKWYRTAVLATTAAVGAGLTLGLAALFNPQSPSLIRTAINFLGRIP